MMGVHPSADWPGPSAQPPELNVFEDDAGVTQVPQTGMVGHVIQTGEAVNVSDTSHDHRCGLSQEECSMPKAPDPDTERKEIVSWYTSPWPCRGFRFDYGHMGYRAKSLLAVPVKCDGVVVAVAQVANKLDKFGQTVPYAAGGSREARGPPLRLGQVYARR